DYSATWEVLDASQAVVRTGSGRDFVFAPGTMGGYTVRFTLVDAVTGAVGNAEIVFGITDTPPASDAPQTIGLTGATQAALGQTLDYSGLLNTTALSAGASVN